MSSIMTNAGAMTALQTLKTINKDLSTTQNRISTGYRVSEASHNAAYWSIATTMRSDNKAMGTVQDALGLGAAQVDVAYTGMDNAKNILDDIKSKLVAASQPDVDKAKIQEEISQLQQSLKSIAESATFSGGNWLSVSETDTQKVVASFIRGENGAISLGTIDIDTASTALFNSHATDAGLVEKGQALDAAVSGIFSGAVAAAGTDGGTPTDTTDDTEATLTFTVPADGFTLEEGDAIKFRVSLNGGEEKTVTIDRATVVGTGLTDGNVADVDELAEVLAAAFTNAGLGGEFTVDGTTGVISTVKTGTEASIAVTGVMSTDNGNFYDATEIDISEASAADLSDYITAIDSMFNAVTGAAAELGANKSRIDSQGAFVGKLMDALDRGIGQLVDADMEEESTRLQALQVQQQLGIQALSIANGNSQNILSLFR